MVSAAAAYQLPALFIGQGRINPWVAGSVILICFLCNDICAHKKIRKTDSFLLFGRLLLCGFIRIVFVRIVFVRTGNNCIYLVAILKELPHSLFGSEPRPVVTVSGAIQPARSLLDSLFRLIPLDGFKVNSCLINEITE